jgi:hypothetical protein
LLQTRPVRRPDFRPTWGTVPWTEGKAGFNTGRLPLSIQGTGENPRIEGALQAKPRRKKGTEDRRRQVPSRVSIGERPNIAEEKSRARDWEGDTVESAGKNACIATFVDRKTKFLLAKLMPNKSAASLNGASVRAGTRQYA